MRACLLGIAIAMLPGAVQAQSVSADLRIGMYTQLGGTATIGATEGKLQTGPVVGLGFDLRSPGAVFGIRLSTAIGATTGSSFQRAQCSGCASSTRDHGRFVGIAADLTAQPRTSGWTLRLGGGLGIVRYDYGGGQGFTLTPCPSDGICTDPFRQGDTRLAVHVGGAAARRVGGVTLVATIESYLSDQGGSGTSSDLSVALGVGLGSLWVRR